MERTYDIFERFPDDSSIWRAHAVGLDNALARLKELADTSKSEFYVYHIDTKTTIARINVPRT